MTACIFCHDVSSDHILLSTTHFFVVFDIDPIQQGHLLIISKHHMKNISKLTDEQLLDLGHLQQKLTTILEENFDILGVTIAMNNGLTMDKNVHFHLHVIPRYSDDTFWDYVDVTEHSLPTEKLKALLKTY